MKEEDVCSSGGLLDVCQGGGAPGQSKVPWHPESPVQPGEPIRCYLRSTVGNLQVLGKLWSALPLEEKEKYERRVGKQRLDQEKQRLDNERQELQDVKIVGDGTTQNKNAGRKISDSDKVNQLSEVPDPYLIFRFVFASKIFGYLARLVFACKIFGYATLTLPDIQVALYFKDIGIFDPYLT